MMCEHIKFKKNKIFRSEICNQIIFSTHKQSSLYYDFNLYFFDPMNKPRPDIYWQCFFLERDEQKVSRVLTCFFAQCKIKSNISMFVLHQNE